MIPFWVMIASSSVVIILFFGEVYAAPIIMLGEVFVYIVAISILVVADCGMFSMGMPW